MKFWTYMLILGFALHAPLAAEQTRRVGYAYAENTDDLLYTETHNEVRENGEIIMDHVSYRDEEGRLFATKTVDFSKHDYAPDFSLENQRTGHVESGTMRGPEYHVEFSRNQADDLQSQALSLPENAVADAGFDQVIASHWDEITRGETLKRRFLIPSMFGFYDFRIYQSEIIEINEGKSRVIKVEPDNFFYRLVGGSTHLEYAWEAPRLKLFRGVSNMRDENGENLQVRIVFPQEDRQVVSHP